MLHEIWADSDHPPPPGIARIKFDFFRDGFPHTDLENNWKIQIIQVFPLEYDVSLIIDEVTLQHRGYLYDEGHTADHFN